MKKALSLILCAAILLSTLVVAASAAASSSNINMDQTFVDDGTFRLGDANSDGRVDGKDALLIKGYVVGNNEDKDVSSDAGDIDADGTVTARDAFYLKASFAGNVSLSNYENGKQVYKFRIAGLDISQFKIVLPAGYSYDSNAYAAYELLFNYIKKATGKALASTTGTPAHGIYIQQVSPASSVGKTLGIEGYTIEVSNGNLYITGTYRGCMYAAYTILEDYLGFRFFDNKATFEYKKRVVDIEEGTKITKVPKIGYRYVGQVMGTTGAKYDDGEHPHNARMHYALARKINASENVNDDGDYGFKGSRYQTMDYYGYFTGPVFLNAHSFYYLYAMGSGTMPGSGTLVERYAAKEKSGEDPSRMMGNWQPCMTNNAVYEVLFAGLVDTINFINARGYITKFGEGIGMMAFSVNDNDKYCMCGECNKRAVTDGEGYFGIVLEKVNRAAADIQSYFPGMRLMTCLYFEQHKSIPKTVRPASNVVIMYCGHGCGNHRLDTRGCGSGYNIGGVRQSYDYPLHLGNDIDQRVLPVIANMCKQSGAEIWFWDYPTTDAYCLVDSPNVTNIYYDYRWLYEQGVTGFFYEGDPLNQNPILFETTKGYMASQMMWNPDMSFEEFTALLKEYLYMYYGSGYEYMYQYLLLWEAAGDDTTCWQCAYDRPMDYFSSTFLANHYDEMRALLVNARDAASAAGGSQSGKYEYRIDCQIVGCDLLCLTACYKTWLLAGTATHKYQYEQRLQSALSFIRQNKIQVYDIDGLFTCPGTPSLAVPALAEIYQYGGVQYLTWGNR